MSEARLEAVRDDARPVRLVLQPGKTYVVGRGDEADLRIPGEPNLSRKHLRARLEDGRLHVERMPGSANPVFHQGQAKEHFFARPGEQFVVGGTRFAFVADGVVADGPPPVEQMTLALADLHARPPASDRLKLLDLLELPELLRSKSESEFFLHVATLLRLACRASWVRIAAEDGRMLSEDVAEELGGRREPSRTLVAKALDESPRPTLFRWSSAGGATMGAGLDWAIASAARVPGEPALIFYVAGADAGNPAELEETARLVGLVVDIVGRTLSVRRLEARERRLERFFSKAVISEILVNVDAPQALEPRLTDSTVMFFDIRGFSKLTEGKCGKILEHIGSLRTAMNAMTEEVFRENGVVLKYTGDGLLACWNVPVADPRHVDRAARSALAMARRLGEVVPGWRCGIGLHAGEVVAGAIGSEQLFAYEVLGAVVNQASRIEGITKFVEAPILVSREVASRLSPDAACSVRLGRFQPAGMNVALELFELIAPPGDTERCTLIAKGLEALEAGEWEKAYELLDERPAKDLPARFLKSLADRHRRHPPKDWQGIIVLDEK